jgi:hypothetical protein
VERRRGRSLRLEHALARKFRDLDVSYRVEGLRARLEEIKTRHATVRMDDVSFSRRNGEIVRASVTLLPVFDGVRIVALMAAAADSTELSRGCARR